VQPLIEGGTIDAKQLHGLQRGQCLPVVSLEQQPVGLGELVKCVGKSASQRLSRTCATRITDRSFLAAIVDGQGRLAARRSPVRDPFPSHPVNGSVIDAAGEECADPFGVADIGRALQPATEQICDHIFG